MTKYSTNDLYTCTACGFKGNGFEIIRHMRDKHPEFVKPWQRELMDEFKTYIDVPGGR